MKAALTLLVLVAALSASLQQSAAQAAACPVCNFAPCCAPAGGVPTCEGNVCSFKCLGGRYKCGATCFPALANSIQTCTKGNYAYKCKAGASACADLCCKNGPRGSTVTCPVSGGKAVCSFSCPGGSFKCGGKCYLYPVQSNPVCRRGKVFGFKCLAGLSKCGGLCCPNGPAGSKVTCPLNATSKKPYCSYGCPAGQFYCGGRCVAVAAPCAPWCEGNAIKCNCPAGYKRNADWSTCLKA